MKAKPILILIGLWILAMIPRIYWLSQKDGFHNDEITSIMFAERNDLGWKRHFQFDTVFTGKQIKEAFLVTDNTWKEMWDDIKGLWRNSGDIHLNLYFILFRIALGTHKTGEIREVLPRAAALNLILFTISFFAFFALMKRLFKKNEIIPYAATIATFLSTATISSSVYFRPYQLQEMTLVLFAWFFVKYVYVEKVTLSDDKNFSVDLKFLAGMSFFTALTLISVLFSIIYVVFIGFFVVLYCIYKKRCKDILVYALVLVTAFGIDSLMFSPYMSYLIDTITGGVAMVFGNAPRPDQAQVMATAPVGADGEKTIFQQQMDVVFSQKPIPSMLSQMYDHYWTAPFIAVTLLAALCVFLQMFTSRKKKEKKNSGAAEKKTVLYMAADFVLSPHFALVASSLAFILLGISAASFKELRYGAPAYPFFVIVPAAIISLIKDRRVMITLSVALVVSSSLFDFREEKVPNVWHGMPERIYKFAKEPSIPAFIIANSNHFPLILPYLADGQEYIFNNKIYPTFQKFNFPEFFLIINDPIIEQNVIDSETWRVEDVYKVGINIGLWTVGRLKRLVPADAVPMPPDEPAKK